MPEKGVELLVVGADDSNHAGTAKGEIIVATFSFLREDAIIKKFPNHRDFRRTLNWLESPNRDYRSALLTQKKYRHSSQNLVEIVPVLITGYMEQENITAENLDIFLDGRLANGGRGKIKEMFKDFRGIRQVVVDNFVKKKTFLDGKVEKHPECPEVVYHADILANRIYSTTFENPKLIYVD